jgi:hypothetical protein
MSCPNSCARRRAGGVFRQVRQERADAERSEDPDQIEQPQAQVPEEPESTPTFCFHSSRISDAGGGRRWWLSQAKRQLKQHRWESRIRSFAPAWTDCDWRSGAWRPTFRPSGLARDV